MVGSFFKRRQTENIQNSETQNLEERRRSLSFSIKRHHVIRLDGNRRAVKLVLELSTTFVYFAVGREAGFARRKRECNRQGISELNLGRKSVAS